jgi:hypothetical protein
MKRIPASQRSAMLRYYYRKRARNLAAGLTVLGKPRSPKRAVWKWPAKVRKAKQLKWSKDANRRLREQNLAAGMTTRGTPRLNRQFPELRGLASTNRKEYQRIQYHLRKQRACRSNLAALVGGEATLLTQLQ